MDTKPPKPKKKMGRPKKFSDRDGSPMLTTRLNPPVFDHIKNHPEGTRPYIERLVTEDAGRTGMPLGGAGQSRDVPGQLHLETGEER